VTRLLAAFAVVGAAWVAVATPDVAPEGGARPVLLRASAPLAHSNSREGQAILTAANLKPGERRAGRVTVVNRGHAGHLYLVARRPARDSGPALSDRLSLAIDEDGGNAIAAGSLDGATTCHPLGQLDGGESRTYVFTVGLARDAGNAYAGATARVDYEWLQTAAARDACPERSDDGVELPVAGEVALTLADLRLAIEPGPYRFARRTGTARVGIRCLLSAAGVCRGRLELERRRAGQGRGLAMAVGNFNVPTGKRRTITVRLNRRARRRISATGAVPVRAFVTARDAAGRRHRVAYRDRLIYRR
jgi:hypothetical protein